MDIFLIFDHMQTTKSRGENPSDDLMAQQKEIHPKYRLRKYPSREEYWESREEVEFRYIASKYSEFPKFLKWVKEEVICIYDRLLSTRMGKFQAKRNISMKNLAKFQNSSIIQMFRKRDNLQFLNTLMNLSMIPRSLS